LSILFMSIFAIGFGFDSLDFTAKKNRENRARNRALYRALIDPMTLYRVYIGLRIWPCMGPFMGPI